MFICISRAVRSILLRGRREAIRLTLLRNLKAGNWLILLGGELQTVDELFFPKEVHIRLAFLGDVEIFPAMFHKAGLGCIVIVENLRDDGLVK